MATKRAVKETAEIIPLFGRDEMNLVEFPFGPVTSAGGKTFEVEHPVFDRALNREVTRKLVITGSDAYGLPRPIDDQVLLGMKALTYEAGFKSPRVEFTRYRLCKTIGWSTDGRSYRRLEEAFDRIAGTTLKFKDSWWDKGEEIWQSKLFHMIESVSLTSRDQIERSRKKKGTSTEQLCSFVWNETIWKSFTDGFIKKIDMEMFRKISSGHKHEVATRLYRILDKRFHKRMTAKFEVRKLCIGTLGVSVNHRPSELIRLLQRSADWLVECGYLREMRITRDETSGKVQALFVKAGTSSLKTGNGKHIIASTQADKLVAWFRNQSAERQTSIEEKAFKFCRVNYKSISNGYTRTKEVGGEAFERYREMLVKTFIESRTKTKAA
jgi:hypothetical protein